MKNPHGQSRLVTWLGRLAWACLLIVACSVLLIRVGMDVSIGLAAFGLGCLVSLLLTVTLAIACLRPRYRGQRGAILRSVLPALPPALLLVTIILMSAPYPAIHDITTDTEDPPLFDAGAARRGDKSNPLDIKPGVIAIQKQHYPDLHTIVTPLDEAAALRRAGAVAESLAWVVYNSDPRKGILEASYTSPGFGFVDDIVIRVRPGADGTAIDLRSVSRLGRGDLGANANRIRAFIEAFERS